MAAAGGGTGLYFLIVFLTATMGSDLIFQARFATSSVDGSNHFYGEILAYRFDNVSWRLEQLSEAFAGVLPPDRTTLWTRSTAAGSSTVFQQFNNGQPGLSGCTAQVFPWSSLFDLYALQAKMPRLNRAQLISNVGARASLVPNDALIWAVTYQTQTFVVAWSPSQNKPLMILGQTFTLTVLSFDWAIRGWTQLSDGVSTLPPLGCPVVNTTSTASNFTVASTCFWKCQDRRARLQQTFVKEKCVLLHGLTGEGKTPTIDYWGGTNGQLMTGLRQLCRTVVTPFFGSLDPVNTINHTASEFALQDLYYNLAMTAQPPTGVVFAHSMGNTILARACIDQNKCTRWFASAGPILGTSASDRTKENCPVAKGGLNAGSSAWQYLVSNVVDTVKKCVPGTYSLQTCGRINQNASTVCNVTQILPWIQGVQCGTSSWGLNSAQSPGLWAVGTYFVDTPPADSRLIPNTYYNDGAVPISSCTAMMGTNSPQGVASSRFYLSECNHSDLAGTGDGWYGDGRMCTSWYLAMAKL